MAISSHVRSISFPSRSQPEYLKVEIELNRLKTWESSSISSTATPLTLNNIQEGIVGLAELYNCVQDLLESPTTQQALLKHQMGRLVEEALESSVGLIDSCGSTRELVLMMKQQVQDLQSALRRKVGDSSTQNCFDAYISFRKKVKKDIAKNLKALKQIENKIESSPLSKLNAVLREVSALTISVLRSQLSFLSAPASKAKKNGWSLISKMLVTKSMTSKGDLNTINEVECVDFALCSNIHISNFKVDVPMIQRKLQILNAGLQGLEAGTDSLSRLLIRNRVCLLNILTP
ncbi:PREDICTED: uncharacterized protein LOC109212303 [Nicotiana attenuata]|uniref:DUF241 domain protein n=1 Tax=Nicotiana attenuata TaxID=49451 RepID=A0A314KHJ3_NICAT|nr:PREDICTED: uncharacterized protein LOC109212303 [Nicotiana attenuata]OIT28717.1 hypothetical protein A4A49_22295 [Nicotiana attenuata]